MRPALLIHLVCLLLCCTHPAVAGGAWPRGKGKVFASLSWRTFGDVVGYIAALQEPQEEVPELLLTDELGLYAEYGLTTRTTIGVDSYHRPETEVGSTIWFLRSSVGGLDWTNRYAIELGFGLGRDWRGNEETILRAGLSWGRSYASRWGDGWIDVDSKAGWLMETEESYWKVDSTLGLTPTEKSIVFVQMQTGAVGGNPSYLRAVPTYVRRMGHGISLESALLLGVKNDEAQGVKIGAWLEF